MTTNPPRSTVEALRIHQQITSDLLQWAPIVHQLVRERITALAEASGPSGHSPSETLEEYAARVLAGGQEPFPVGECGSDPARAAYPECACGVESAAFTAELAAGDSSNV